MSTFKVELLFVIICVKCFISQVADAAQDAQRNNDCLAFCEGNALETNQFTRASPYEACYFNCLQSLENNQKVNFDCRPWNSTSQRNCVPFPELPVENQIQGNTNTVSQNPQTVQNTRRPQTVTQNTRRPQTVTQNTRSLQTGTQNIRRPIQQNGRIPQRTQQNQNANRRPLNNQNGFQNFGGRPSNFNNQRFPSFGFGNDY